MIHLYETPSYRVVHDALLEAAERRYPKGHFVAFSDTTGECGNSADFDALMEDLLSRGYTPDNSLIVRMGDRDETLLLTAEPN